MQPIPYRNLRRAPLWAGIVVLTLAPLGAFADAPTAAAPQDLQDPPVIRFTTSGTFAFATGRITVDARLPEGARLVVTLTSPSGARENLVLERDGHRFSWTGRLEEAGVWRAEAAVNGVRPRQTVSATVLLEEGAPTCSVSIHAPEQPTHYLTAELVADACDATAATGEIATRYLTVFRDGLQVATLDASGLCERRFVLPGDGAYEATLTVADNRGFTATCTTTDVDVEGLHPRFWPFADYATGIYSSERDDLAADASTAAWLSGGGIGLTFPHDPAAETTTALSIRAGGGFAHNFWVGTSLDVLLTRQSPRGFVGGGAGLWGIGDPDILDAGVFGAFGFNLPAYIGAGQAQVFAELRLFARRITAPRQNFSGLVGVRLNFKPTYEIRAR